MRPNPGVITRRSLMVWASRRMLCVALFPADKYTVILALQDEVFGSAYAAAVYLSSVLKFPKDKRVYVIGMSGLEDELRSEGVSFIGGTVSRTFVHHPSFVNAHLIRRIPRTTHFLRQAKYHQIPQLAPCLSVLIRPLTTRSCRARSDTSIQTLNVCFSLPMRTLRTHRRRVYCPVQAPSFLLSSRRWAPIDQSQRSENRAT